jgi:hypothetical protein
MPHRAIALRDAFDSVEAVNRNLVATTHSEAALPVTDQGELGMAAVASL